MIRLMVDNCREGLKRMLSCISEQAFLNLARYSTNKDSRKVARKQTWCCPALLIIIQHRQTRFFWAQEFPSLCRENARQEVSLHVPSLWYKTDICSKGGYLHPSTVLLKLFLHFHPRHSLESLAEVSAMLPLDQNRNYCVDSQSFHKLLQILMVNTG
jgi:hypothetical protein